jgi:flagellar protein FliT
MSDRLDTERRIVERYRRMADASGRMLAAARTDDWDAVCRIEKECATIIADLSTMGDLAPTDPTLRQQKLELVRRVLADDAEIRALSQPWMNKLDEMMRGQNTALRMRRAYGGSSSLRG